MLDVSAVVGLPALVVGDLDINEAMALQQRAQACCSEVVDMDQWRLGPNPAHPEFPVTTPGEIRHREEQTTARRYSLYRIFRY